MSSIIYRVRNDGETFDTVARRVYGDPFNAGRIARANPGVDEPLEAGTALTMPETVRSDRPVSFGRQGTAVVIDGEEFTQWESLSIVRGLDRIESVSLSAPFDPDDSAFRRVFRPFSYKPLEVYIGGAREFTGTLVDVAPSLSESQRTVSVEAYSLPGVLTDCTPPASALPLEFEGADLRDIATRLVEPFGLSVVFDAPPGAVFEQTSCEPTRSILSFLSDLARDRGLVSTSDSQGRLIFRRGESSGPPVADLREGEPPLIEVVPEFSPQQMFSDVTAVQPSVVGAAGARYSVRNPALTGTIRPHNFAPRDIESVDIEQSAKAKAGRMVGNSVAYGIACATWVTPDGVLWAPGQRVTLYAPGAMVYTAYEFEIRRVEFREDESGRTASIRLAIPGTFSGELPERLPWDE